MKGVAFLLLLLLLLLLIIYHFLQVILIDTEECDRSHSPEIRQLCKWDGNHANQTAISDTVIDFNWAGIPVKERGERSFIPSPPMQIRRRKWWIQVWRTGPFQLQWKSKLESFKFIGNSMKRSAIPLAAETPPSVGKSDGKLLNRRLWRLHFKSK